MKELLKIEKLCREFKLESGTQKILKDIDLTIYEGDFTVIMGSSGSGKSTLLYALSGMDMATNGHILFGETDLTTLNGDKMAEFRRKHVCFALSIGFFS